ncbi:hypothetical protein [Actinomadura sp. 7K534]|uniref:hypothetical protein n=2 Tax=Bacillati TaxID=1783272 RepID=UPI001043043C|nr:hypothetical protein [Actinomadura sp. 7K534]TDB96064.1 hypothetical protein E1266_11130 [Actinomadura sp. 7K534]
MSGMETPASRTDEDFEAIRVLMIGAMVLCAVGTLGAVAKAAAPANIAGRAPGFADVFRINPGVVSVEAAVVVAVVTIAGVAALWWSVRRTWPWLLVAGVVLVLIGESAASPVPVTSTTSGGPSWLAQGTAVAGAHLVLLGTLGAALMFVGIKAAGAGAVLIGAGLGAQVFGAATDVLMAEALPLEPGGHGYDYAPVAKSLLHIGLLLGAVGAMVLVGTLHLRYGKRPELAVPSDAEPAVDRLMALAGAAGALLFVPAAVIGDGEFGVAASALLLVAGLVFSVLAGPRAVAGLVLATAVVAGVSGPAGALIQAGALTTVSMWFWTASGIVVGAAVAFPVWRSWSAAVGCGLCGVLLLVLMAVRPDGVALVMLALLIAAATAAVASLGVWLARDGSLPVVLGPLAFATITGACGLLAHWQGSGRRAPGEELFREPGHLWLYAALLLAAAAAFAFRARGRSPVR